jgi:hypothetical protein
MAQISPNHRNERWSAKKQCVTAVNIFEAQASVEQLGCWYSEKKELVISLIGRHSTKFYSSVPFKIESSGAY